MYAAEVRLLSGRSCFLSSDRRERELSMATAKRPPWGRVAVGVGVFALLAVIGADNYPRFTAHGFQNQAIRGVVLLKDCHFDGWLEKSDVRRACPSLTAPGYYEYRRLDERTVVALATRSSSLRGDLWVSVDGATAESCLDAPGRYLGLFRSRVGAADVSQQRRDLAQIAADGSAACRRAATAALGQLAAPRPASKAQ